MSATQAIVTDNRSKRQVERDTRRNEATAQKRLTSKGATFAAVIIAIFWTIPTLGLFVTSFRPGADSNSTGWWTAFVNPSFTLSNYADALNSGGTALTLGASFVNSLAITIPATVIPIFIASLAAYGFAWMNFKGKNLVFVFVFALQIVPIQMALVPLLSLFSRGLTLFGTQIFPGFTLRDVDHSFATVWIAHAIFAMPLAIFMLHNFIAEIPGRSSRPPAWTGQDTGRSSSASSCRWRCRPSRRSRSSSSCGCGTTCWWRRSSRRSHRCR